MRKPQRENRESDKTRINERIRAPKVRLIGPDGSQLGIHTSSDALRIAKEQYDLDLVEVASQASPPVCKILDYGKHKYQIKKKAQEAKRNQATTQLKEVKFRPKTDVHDFNFKVKHVTRFLKDSDKVKVSVFFRGREVIYSEIGRELLKKVYSLVEDLCQMEQQPNLEGRYMSMILVPRGNKSAPQKVADSGEDE